MCAQLYPQSLATTQLRLLENKVSRRTFGFEKGEDTKHGEQQPDEEHHSSHFTLDIVGVIK
jgi:hypothetical protein